MAEIEVTTVALGARVTLMENDEVHHRMIYRNIDEALWQGLRWGLKTVVGVSGVVIDGESVNDEREVADRLWRYLDGMGDREPKATFLTNEMIELLSL